MPLDISANAIIEKNKLTSNGEWYILLDISYPGESTVYVCLNNETVTWPSVGGNDYVPAVFNLSGIVESKDAEIPSVPLSIWDLNRTLTPIIRGYGGAVGATVTIRQVHSKYLSNTVPESEEEMEIIDTQINSQSQITFKLGAENLQDRRCPQQRYLKNNCRFLFKRSQVTFTSGGTTELVVGNYLKGDTSSDTAKVIKIKLTSGSWAGGDAAGVIILDTIQGGFSAENVSSYSDSGFSTLIQSNVVTFSSATEGRCGYIGAETDCNRSRARCIELNNNIRVGAFPAVGSLGFLK